MRSKIIKLLAFSLKAIAGFYWINYILSFYNPKSNFIKDQPMLFWILVFIPLFMGYERLIVLIFSKPKKEESKK